MAKILFIAPDEVMKDSIAEALADYKQYSLRFNRPQEDCEIELAVGLWPLPFDARAYNADIIVSRGALAAALRRSHADIPIVELPITTIDVISCVRQMQALHPGPGPIGVVGFGDVPYQLKIAAELCDAELIPFDYYNENIGPDDLEKILDEIQGRGLKRVIGGIRTARLAMERGMASSPIRSGRESIWPAITEALHIARIRRTERERAARLEAILNHAHEGIIATDAKNGIIQLNRAAAEMLEVDSGACAGVPLERVIPDPRVVGMTRSDANYADELLALGKHRFVLSKTSIRLAEEAIGNLLTLQKVSDVQHTEIAIRSKLHHRGLSAKYSFADIIGESPAIKDAVRKARVFAKAPSNILITGETGTGKELFAQSIHRESDCRNGPFVAVNCAAIPENLAESEFFGYEPGAFTGAAKEGKSGFFELAHEGTIFLDEISEIPLRLQGKLLRVLQESEVMRLGSDRVIPVKVRIVCAVNKDLGELVRTGAFREDLYYRLAVLQLRLPPLRERERDIALLAEHFVRCCGRTYPERIAALSPAAADRLVAQRWDGNIRELRNICEQLVVLSGEGTIAEAEVESLLPAAGSTAAERPEAARAGYSAPPSRNDPAVALRDSERRLILETMENCGCNKTEASRRLGIDRSTLWRKLKDYGIDCRTTLR